MPERNRGSLSIFLTRDEKLNDFCCCRFPRTKKIPTIQNERRKKLYKSFTYKAIFRGVAGEALWETTWAWDRFVRKAKLDSFFFLLFNPARSKTLIFICPPKSRREEHPCATWVEEKVSEIRIQGLLRMSSGTSLPSPSGDVKPAMSQVFFD